MTEQPGWYADPAGEPGTVRWWDGARWTRWLADDAGAAPPPPLVEPTAATTEDSAVPAREEPAAAPMPVAPMPVASMPVAQPPAAQTSLPVEETRVDPPPPVAGAAGPLVRLPVAVAAIVGALVLSVLGVAAVTSASAQRLASGPAIAPPTPTPGANLAYDSTTRKVAVGELSVTLPGPPYRCASRIESRPPAFPSAALCVAPVQEDYDAQGNDWTAFSGVGVVAPELLGADLTTTTGQVFEALRNDCFRGEQTEVRNARNEQVAVAPAGRALARYADVHYQVPGVRSTRDRVYVVVVQLRDGSHGAWFSCRPTSASKASLDALTTSLNGLTAR